jgi:hypothetical protein
LIKSQALSVAEEDLRFQAFSFSDRLFNAEMNLDSPHSACSHPPPTPRNLGVQDQVRLHVFSE